jgi:hypothetical protein
MAGDPWEDMTMTDERPNENPDNPGEPTDAAGSTPVPGATPPSADAGEQTSGWTSGESMWKETPGEADADGGSKMLSQLQAMIDQVATQARPVARQIGIKAAELTAVAADRAGPAAHKAGDVAADASSKLAVRSREFADALRRELGVSGNGSSAEGAADEVSDAVSQAADDAKSAATSVIDRAEDTIDSTANKVEDELNH